MKEAIPIAVTNRDLFDRFLLVGFVDLELEQVELDPLPPTLFGFFDGCRIVDQIRIIIDRFVDGVVLLLVDVFEDRLDLGLKLRFRAIT
jgi:hypothetical protein